MPASFKGSLHFDGTDDFVQIADNSNLNGLSSATFSFWFYPAYSGSPSASRGFFSKSSTHASKALYGLYHYTDGRIYIHLNESNAVLLGSWSPVANTWYHFSLEWNGSTVYLYINNSLLGSASLASGSGTNTRPFFIGAYTYASESGKQPTLGKIDDFCIYNRRVTDAERTQLFKNEFPESGRVAFWPFSEGTGTSLGDISGNNLTGTISGAIWSTESRPSKFSLKFDGVDDYVSVADNNLLDVTTNFTVMGWIKPSAISRANPIVGKGRDGTSTYSFHLFADADNKYKWALFNGSSNPYAQSATPPQANTWHHVAGTYDGTTLRLYINGQLDATASTTINIGNQSSALTIGKWPNATSGGIWCAGNLQDIRVYNTVLSAQDIKKIMNGYEVEAGLVANWPLSDGTGTTVKDIKNNLNGTISGAVWTTDFVKISSSIFFDGVDDHVTIPDANALDLTNQMSFCFWARRFRTGATEIFLSKSDTATATGYKVYIDTSNRVNFHIPSLFTTTATNCTIPAADVWTHIGVSFSGTQTKFYKNGVLTDTIAGSATAGVSANALLYARNYTSQASEMYKGYLKDVVIYNRAITDSEVSSIYNGEDIPSSGLVLWTPLNEGSGTKANDISSNQFTGTLTAGAAFSNETLYLSQSKTSQYLYSITSAAIAQTLKILYGLGGFVNTSKTINYNLRNQAANSRTVLYNLRNKVSESKTLLYYLKNRVTKQNQYPYFIKNRIQQTKTYLYNLKNIANIQKQFVYNSSGIIGKLVSILYDQGGFIGLANNLRYNLKNIASGQKNLSYNIINLATISKSYLYSLLNRVQAQNEFGYNLRNIAQYSAQFLYNSIEEISKLVNLLYNSSGKLAHEISLLYHQGGYIGFANSLNYNINKILQTEFQFLYSIFLKAENSIPFFWNIVSHVEAESLVIAYTISEFLDIDLGIVYNILRPIPRDVSLVYSSGGMLRNTTIFRYKMGGVVPKQAEIQYNIVESILQNLEILHNIRNISQKENNLQYNILSTILYDNMIFYSILNSASIEERFNFNISSLLEKETRLDYMINNPVSGQNKITYDIKNIISRAKELVFGIKNILSSQWEFIYSTKELANVNINSIYSILNILEKNYRFNYNLLNTSGQAEIELKYSTKEIANLPLSSIYNINTRAEALLKLDYQNLEVLAKILDLKYRLQAYRKYIVIADEEGEFIILKSHKHRLEKENNN